MEKVYRRVEPLAITSNAMVEGNSVATDMVVFNAQAKPNSGDGSGKEEGETSEPDPKKKKPTPPSSENTSAAAAGQPRGEQ